jgi:hypothetical protein
MKSHLSIFAALLLAPMDALHGANPTSAENSAAKTWANEHLFADQNKFPFSFIRAALAHAKRHVANTMKSIQSSIEQTLPETTSPWRKKSKTCNRRIGTPSGLCGHRHQVVPLPDPRLMVVFRDSAPTATSSTAPQARIENDSRTSEKRAVPPHANSPTAQLLPTSIACSPSAGIPPSPVFASK